MRIGWKLLLVVAGSAVIACAGQYTVQEGGGGGGPPTPSPSPSGTPFPTASKPPQASFNTDIEPILDKATCGRNGCHDTTTKSGGTGLSTLPVVTSPTLVQLSANLASIACNSPLDSFQPPAGRFLTYFCSSSTTAYTGATGSTSDHIPGKVTGGTIVDADCVKMYGWVSSGGTGTLGACP